MRYDTKVTLISPRVRRYDPERGARLDAEATEWWVSAHISPQSTEQMLQLYGRVNQDAFLVRVLGRYGDPVEEVRIGEDRYTVTATKRFRHDTVWFVERSNAKGQRG